MPTDIKSQNIVTETASHMVHRTANMYNSV